MLLTAKTFLRKHKQYLVFYVIGCAVVFGLKLFYSGATVDDLNWIMAPTAWWVRILSNTAFIWEEHIGYVNHDLRFIIAAACSGVQFMTIVAAVLIFPFVHRMGTTKRGFVWIISCLCFSYLYTVFTNGFRIVLSIYLPILLQNSGVFGSDYLSPERLHTIIGTGVYFASLVILYRAAGTLANCIAPAHEADKPRAIFPHALQPLFWYATIALGIPFLNSAYRSNDTQFTEYALLIIAVCTAVLVLFCLISSVRKLRRPRM